MTGHAHELLHTLIRQAQRGLPLTCRVALAPQLLLLDKEHHRPHQRGSEEAETDLDWEAERGPARLRQQRVDDDHDARPEGGDARQDKLGAVPEVAPAQALRGALWPGGDFGRCEAEPDKAREGEQQVEGGPEEVGRAPRLMSVRRSEEQHGSPAVGNEEAGEGDAEGRNDQLVNGRVVTVHEDEDDAVDENEVADLVAHADGLGELRLSMLPGERVEDEVPREGGDGAHPEEAVHQRAQTHDATSGFASEEDGG